MFFFKVMMATLVIASVAILYFIHALFSEKVFFIMTVMQSLWALVLAYFFYRLFSKWKNANIEISDTDLILNQAKSTVTIPFSSITKIIVQRKDREIVMMRMSSDIFRRDLIVPPAAQSAEFYEHLRTKIDNPFKIEDQSYQELAGWDRITISVLFATIMLTVLFRIGTAAFTIMMRPDLNVSYARLVMPTIFEVSIACSFLAQILRRKRWAFAILAFIGALFLVADLRAAALLDLGSVPTWYLFSFWAYNLVLAVGVFAALFMLIKPPVPLFVDESVGTPVT
jgi:hypothetical protein